MIDPLLERWRNTLDERGHSAPAVLDATGAVQRTFGEIEREAQKVATHTLRGLSPGAVLALQIGNHPSWPALLLACRMCGVVVLPLETAISEHERAAALALCHGAGLVSAAEHDVRLSRGAINHPDWEGEAPALLKLTSGTTEAPRAIRFNSHQLLADADNICTTMGITASDMNFGVIPVSHSYGFSNLLTPLLARGVPLVLSGDRMPRAVLENIGRTRATVFPGMPVFYQAFSAMPQLPELISLRLCISAGAPLPLALARAIRDRLHLPVHSFYGSSECGGICYDRDAALEVDGFVGGPLKGVAVELLDAGAEASRIRVRSEAVASGYFPQPDVARLAGGIFAPDDLLGRVGSGYRIVGRVSDVINVAGKKVHPAEVEAVLRRCAGVREAVVFGRKSALRNEEVAACVVAEAGVSEAALLDFCRSRLSGWQVPRRICFVEEIPVSERGKISRRALAARFGG